MNKHYFILSGFMLLCLLILVSCRSDRQQLPKPAIDNLDEKILNANKLIVKDEAKDIELLLKRYGWKMQSTGSGLYYSITDNKEGNLLQKGDKVEINYSISLINGKEVYNSKQEGTKTIVIEQSDEPVGLHELLKLMRVGEKAKAIIPSHLAYGILGDNNKIPPYATLIYRIEIIK
ncbi:MAG TPA: FKBP-type peptidyl-prolyl cis-trans isomerase [Bacteroidales bacterium]|nr:hypothetical protein [Bacteroidales bacterium]OQA84608.1 MAG: FKBP-type 22 kDa peptidyl-prolyl cis-trans isomerase [Bacteroidetes bacterium ADurb.Bin234]HOS16663.1 FKBP-type peptidyl-prolyl cis-trans isomerase [Bacteroidales bacterium]